MRFPLLASLALTMVGPGMILAQAPATPLMDGRCDEYAQLAQDHHLTERGPGTGPLPTSIAIRSLVGAQCLDWIDACASASRHITS